MQESLLVFNPKLKSMLWLTWVSIHIVNVWKLRLFGLSQSFEVFTWNPIFLIFKILLPNFLNLRAYIRRRYVDAWLVEWLFRQTIKIFDPTKKPLLWLNLYRSSFLKILVLNNVIFDNWYFSIGMIYIS